MSLTIDQMNQISLARYGESLDVQPQGAEQGSVSEPEQGAGNDGVKGQPPPRAAQTELNRLMQSVARETYSEVTSESLSARVPNLTGKHKKELTALANQAQNALRAIKDLTVREILNTSDPRVEELFNTAADLQFQLANKLREFATSKSYVKPKFNGYRQMLDDLSLKCDSRGSEILTLFMEIRTFGEAQAIKGGSTLESAKAEDLLKGMAGSMHGNDKALLFKNEVAFIESSLANFAASPTVKPDDLQALQTKTLDLSARLKAPDVARTMDPQIHARLTERLDTCLTNVTARVEKAAKKASDDVIRQVGSMNLIGRNLAEFFARNPKLEDVFPHMFYVLDRLERIGREGPTQDDDIRELGHDLFDHDLSPEIRRFLSFDYPGKPDLVLDTNGRSPREALFRKIGINPDGLQMAKRIRTEIRTRKTDWASRNELKLAGEDVVNAFRKNDKLSLLLETRINGATDSNVNEQLRDENLVAKERLGSGAANTVYKMTYRMSDGSTKDYVFKPDLGGRLGLETLTIGINSYAFSQQAVKHNVATCDTAELLGLGNLTGKVNVTVHDGHYGLLMELAPGSEGATVANSRDPSVRQKFADRQIVGRLAKELNDLRWLDILTGQGDRHHHNYLVDFGSDGRSPKVTAIDNDMCFTPYVVGVGKFNVNHNQERYASFLYLLREACQQTNPKDPETRYTQLLSEIEANNGIVDTKTAGAEVLVALRDAFGFHNLSLPKQMSRNLCDKLANLTDQQIDAYAAKIRTNVDNPLSVTATVQRLKDLREIAKDYAARGLVVVDGDWETNDDVLKREMESGYTAPKSDRTLTDQTAEHFTSSLLKRDFSEILDPALKKKLTE